MFRLAAERALQLADVSFSEIPDSFVEIREIIRNGSDGTLSVRVGNDESLHVFLDGVEKLQITQGNMSKLAEITFNEMHGSKNYEEAEMFLDRVGCAQVKADSHDKTDISIRIHDPRTGTEPLMRYSIKSDVGSKSTLFNATSGAMITYEIDGPIDDAMAKIVNSFENNTKPDDSEATSKTQGKVKKRFVYLQDKGCKFRFLQDNSPFHNNLMYVDSAFPKILAEVVLKYYSTGGKSSVKDLVEKVSKENPLNVPESIRRTFYEYKVKNFLVLVALGMTQGTPWDVRESVTGGIILVKDTGKIVCYHMFDRNDFENHLYTTSRIDTPSTSRHADSKVHKTVEGKYTISVAMQVRLDKASRTTPIDPMNDFKIRR